MGNVCIIDGIDIKQQLNFIGRDYPSFLYSAVYGYLFERLQLREIEYRYLGEVVNNGFFAKTVLNLVGIDTSKKAKNCGRFAGQDVQDTAKQLLEDADPIVNNIGRILLKTM